MSPALQSACYRFAAVLIALLAAAAVWALIPDPSIKNAASGLVVAAILALEELLKWSGPVAAATPRVPADPVAGGLTLTPTPAAPPSPPAA